MTGAVLVYDDDCGFCTYWADAVAARSDLQLVGFTDLDSDLRSQLPEEYETCSHLVDDGAVYSCGASMEEAALRTDVGSYARPLFERLRRFGAYRSLREWGYRQIADHRSLVGRVFSKTPPARTDGNDADAR